nr:UDP-N-acetylmuramate--alanine ligase [Leuconostoc palmae]
MLRQKMTNSHRIYRTLNDENMYYKKIIFELRKGELQYFTFVSSEVK